MVLREGEDWRGFGGRRTLLMLRTPLDGNGVDHRPVWFAVGSRKRRLDEQDS